ncbi:hypothetical protein LTS18_007294, partial [Coniosporium uncinatum]
MSETPTSDQERREADIVAKHLPEGFSADPEVITDQNGDASASAPELGQPQQDSLKLQGGDMHRDIFKKSARARLPQRAMTFSAPTRTADDLGLNEEPNAQDQMAPGGFRRQYLQRNHQRFHSVTVNPVTQSFVSFLDLYGSFAGEDLAESEDESALEEEEEHEEEQPQQGERRPLLGRRKSSKMQRQKGDAGMTKSFFTLLKAFIGTGIMFLPKAFKNGGLLFSSITLVTVALLTTLAFHLLLQCRSRYGGGYGELGEAIGGRKFRNLILSSIFISQIGFVCAGIVFTAENLFSFAQAVSQGNDPINTKWLIGIQLLVIIPMALIRNVSKLGPAALLADVFIFLGLGYIW